jgi:hypothetical protein
MDYEKHGKEPYEHYHGSNHKITQRHYTGALMLRQDDYMKAQLVTIGWRWGLEYGGHLASCMIMSCLSNRVRLGWGTWLEVLDRIPTFAAQQDMPTGTPSIWEPNFVRLLHEVEAIFDGSMDYAKGALYWCDTRRIETKFFAEKILGNLEEHPRILEMNTLVFFK